MTLDRFLIIGAHRSGTSLLTRILNQHSTLAVPPESFFFNTFVPLRKFYGDLERDENFARLIDDVLSTPKVSGWSPTPTREQILERVAERSMGAVFLALLDTWAESQGKTYWGEKTPHHVFYWPEIRGLCQGRQAEFRPAHYDKVGEAERAERLQLLSRTPSVRC